MKRIPDKILGSAVLLSAFAIFAGVLSITGDLPFWMTYLQLLASFALVSAIGGLVAWGLYLLLLKDED